MDQSEVNALSVGCAINATSLAFIFRFQLRAFITSRLLWETDLILLTSIPRRSLGAREKTLRLGSRERYSVRALPSDDTSPSTSGRGDL